MRSRISLCALYFVLFISTATSAQWSADPATNLAIGDRTGEQTQPKVHATADGGCYISWFDNATGGYDVYLQRLDANGFEMWPHNGVLLADRSLSSTQDYDLDVDADGNALLAFRDDRFVGTQITATKVDPSGMLVWGISGVQLTATTAFVAAPKIAATSDGGIVVGWTQNTDVALQRLDADGVPQWPADVVLSDTGGGEFLLSDLGASDAGNVIVSWNRQQSFMANKHIWAQKLDSDGNPLWVATHVRVFDSGSLQFGNFPTFVSDGSGGAVFGWYETGPLQCRAQHILFDGSEAFPHNGVVASTFPRDRVAPSVAFDATTSSTYLFWREQVGPPTPQDGIYGQRFDASGNRQWTDDGVVVEALSTTEKTQVRTLALNGGAVTYWVEALSFGNQRIHAERLDASGTAVWPMAVEVSTVASGKSRLLPDLNVVEAGLLVWADDRTDDNDIYAQNVNASGVLGPDVECFTYADCADLDGDFIRDDVCAFWECVGGKCMDTVTVHGDVGGQLGACQADGATDSNDLLQIQRCFTNTDGSGMTPFTCEAAAPLAYNVDVGAPGDSCQPDGVCDGHDYYRVVRNIVGDFGVCTCDAPQPEVASRRSAGNKGGPQGRMFMSLDGFEYAMPDTGNTTVHIAPGTTQRIMVWFRDPTGSFFNVNGYQIILPDQAAPIGMSQGTVSYVDTAPGQGMGGSITVDTNRSDFLFDSLAVGPGLYNETPALGLFGTLYVLPTAMNIPPSGDVQYLAEFDIAASADADGEFELAIITTGSAPPRPVSDVFGVLGEPYPSIEYQPLTVVIAAPCETFATCADVDEDGIRDDGCIHWGCDFGLCEATDVGFADMGGQFGQCPPDGTADGNDRFHALRCFSNEGQNRGEPYECEDNAPFALNVDTGGSFGSCQPDGVCDANDAFAALNAFSNETTCTCPLDGDPSPEAPSNRPRRLRSR